MKNTFKKLLSLTLCLVMVAVLLPVMPAEAAASAPEGGILLYEETFDSYTSVAAAKAAGWSTPNANSNLSNAGTYYSVGDGTFSFKSLGTSMNVHSDYVLSGLGVVSDGTVELCMEYRLSAGSSKYMARLVTATDGVTVTVDSNRTDATSNSAQGHGYTNTTDFVTHYQYFTVGAGTLDSVSLRLSNYKNDGTETVMFDYIKLYLVTVDGADLQSRISGENAWAKLPGDVAVSGNLTLGAGAVLDLNGHTLTVESGAVNGGENAKLIDSSAEKNGMLAVAENSLVLDSNNSQLPVWTGSGYVFTEPKLNEDGLQRAFFVDGSTSYDGFTLDFRPGFGTAGGKNVRTEYLDGRDAGITMDAQLSWVDIYGNPGNHELICDSIFEGMYDTETARGRLSLTGAEQYQSISLAITLSSCSVVWTFDPMTFTNNNVTTHFAADFESENEITLTSSENTDVSIGSIKSWGSSVIGNGVLSVLTNNQINFVSAIEAAAGKTLVIEFDMEASAAECVAVRVAAGYRSNGTSTGYVNIIQSKGHSGNTATYQADFYSNTSTNGIHFYEAGQVVTVRMEIDLGTGDFSLYRNDEVVKEGTYAQVADVLGEKSSFYINEHGDTNNAVDIYMDNFVVYTITN